MHPVAAEETARLPSVNVKRSWWHGEVSDDYKQADIASVVKKDPGKCRPVDLTSVPGKIIQEILKGIFKHMKD